MSYIRIKERENRESCIHSKDIRGVNRENNIITIETYNTDRPFHIFCENNKEAMRVYDSLCFSLKLDDTIVYNFDKGMKEFKEYTLTTE